MYLTDKNNIMASNLHLTKKHKHGNYHPYY